MEIEKLKSCPFCGGEASLTIPSEHVQADCADIYVSCDECEAEGQHFVVEMQDRTPDLWPYEQRDAIAAWNTRAPAELTGWQPIETAPKDGTEFLALASNGWYVLASAPAEAIKEGWPYAWWRTSGGTRYPVAETHPAGSLSDTGLLLTHWQPLPAPPGTTRAPADCKLADNDGKNCVLLEDHEGSCLSYDPKEVGVRLMSALGHVENCRAHGRVTDAGFAAIRSALLIADRELSRLRAPADLRSALEAETIERAARAMCVHDGLDPDEHIIGGQASGNQDYGPLWQAEQRSEGQLGITDYAGLARAALAPTKGDVS